MKNTRLFIFMRFGVVMGVLFLTILSIGATSIHNQRWDLRMIKEAPIWSNLLKHYFYAEHQRYWPERKATLEKIIKEFPNSQWADDAALILACGKASFENNSAGAILALHQVAQKYSHGQTVVAYWDKADGCRFDEVWLTWQAGLVHLNTNGTIRKINPFGKDGQIFKREKEVLAYFDHLERCPIRTAVISMLFKAKIQESTGDLQGAMVTLENVVSNAEVYLADLYRADKSAGKEQDGFLIRSSLRRPESMAYLRLIDLYERRNVIDKINEKAESLVTSYSPDGWNWEINNRIGDVYARLKIYDLAQKQYQLAETGVAGLIKNFETRRELVEGSEYPDTFWKLRETEIKNKLEKLGKEKKQ